MIASARTRAVALFALLASGLLAGACDDAILGERALPCDGGICQSTPAVEVERAVVGDAGMDGRVQGDACPLFQSDPPGCDGGSWAFRRDEAGCVVGYECTTRECPPIAAPPATFCDGGPIETVYDEFRCARGFACI